MAELKQNKDEFNLIDALRKMKPEEAVRLPEIVAKLTMEQRVGLLEFLENEQENPSEREKHEPRMQAVLADVARASGLQWSSDSPLDHPFHARLDGTLIHHGKRVAVVELETKNRKQIDGSLLDLVTHPEPKKILVIGRSKVVPFPSQLKKEILQDVLPVLQSLLKVQADIGVFTESELRLSPNVLAQFIGLGESQ